MNAGDNEIAGIRRKPFVCIVDDQQDDNDTEK